MELSLSLFLPPELPPFSSGSKKGKGERGTFCSKFRTAAERGREWVFEHGQPTYSPDKAQF